MFFWYLLFCIFLVFFYEFINLEEIRREKDGESATVLPLMLTCSKFGIFSFIETSMTLRTAVITCGVVTRMDPSGLKSRNASTTEVREGEITQNHNFIQNQ